MRAQQPRVEAARDPVGSGHTVTGPRAAAALIQQLKDLGGNFVFTNVSAVNANALAEVLLAAGTGYTADVVVTQCIAHKRSASPKNLPQSPVAPTPAPWGDTSSGKHGPGGRRGEEGRPCAPEQARCRGSSTWSTRIAGPEGWTWSSGFRAEVA